MWKEFVAGRHASDLAGIGYGVLRRGAGVAVAGASNREEQATRKRSPELPRPRHSIHGEPRAKYRSIQASVSLRLCLWIDRCLLLVSVENASALQDVVLSFHKSVFHTTPEILSSTQTSLEWWAVAGPALLWFLLAAPGSVSGVIDFLASPLHARHYRAFSPGDVEVGRRIGEGSYGVVYEGYIGRGKGKDGMHVVLKKAKSQVSNSSQMHNTEVYMNRYLQRNAPGAVAAFLGTVQVKQSQVKGRLTEGLWMVWKFQGYHTLEHYMKQRNFPENLSVQLLGDSALNKRYSSTRQMNVERNGLLLRTIMAQLLSNLQEIHRTGVVHRDVKPLNLILADDSESFKLVDLGACVNLRSGYNYVPNETIMDPLYAPPEQYVMPTWTPELPPDPFCSLISPLIWLLNTPDRFDSFSAGLIMMQLSVKSLRREGAMKNFTGELKRAGHNMNKWRKKCQLPKEEFLLLDADDGAGWELVTALLQPRQYKAFIIWPGLVGSRPSATAALGHRYFKRVRRVEPVKVNLQDLIPAFVNEPQSLTVPAFSWVKGDTDMKTFRGTIMNQMASTLDKMRSPGFTSALAAAVPVAALSCLGISSSWMLLRGLQASTQMSYDISRSMIDSIGFNGPASVAFFFLVVKPFLDKRSVASTKTDRANQKLVNLPSYDEVRRLAEEVGALDSRLGSLEALAAFNSEASLQNRHHQQAARMRSLLAQRYNALNQVGILTFYFLRQKGNA